MKTALLFLNGEPPNSFILKPYNTIGCTDGAYHYAKKLPVKLDFVLGDFDSINPNEIENIEIIIKPDQNYTDFEKAIQYLIEKKINSVEIWGGSGKEEDHFLGNISVLVQYHKKIEMIFHTDTHYFFMAKKVNHFRVKKNKIISLFPLNHVKEITTSGLEFPLKNESLKIGKRIGIRNKSKDKQISIVLKKGKLLTIVEK
ncbi:MAG: thiamine diphosphokinase [Flavobacterium sp.]|jgi:thiamine pyrophosphokinase